MTSTLTWLDFSEHDRQQMLKVITDLGEKETVDELGIGGIRDSIANLLFPGTTTIQTRAKYFLFVPWIYIELERKRIPSSQIAQRARGEEIALINHLSKSGDTDGVIGIDARSALQRLPSNIYWRGLSIWGIKRYKRTQSEYHRYLDRYYDSLRHIKKNDDGEYVEGGFPPSWHAGLPPPPRGFPNEVSLQLSKAEADYLRERILTSVPATLLAFLVDRGYETENTSFPWQHPQYAHFPDHIREQLKHGRNFTMAIHGAALLYNLMLAEQAEREDLILNYRERLNKWSSQLKKPIDVLVHWDRIRFWETVVSDGDKISNSTRLFVNSWLDIAISPSRVKHVVEDKDARQLIHNRERSLKKGLARLDNKRALELWSGNAGTRYLTYRWEITQRIVADILQGLH